MKLKRYFPLGKAHGDAFCNRCSETEKLVRNIQRGVHTYFLAPRRYGKSSLSEKALSESGLNWTKVDFHLAVNEKDVERFIIKGVLDLIGKTFGQIEKLSNTIKSQLKHLRPKFDISAGPFKLELETDSASTPAENVAEALFLLEKLLQENQKQAAFLFDEFQEVGHLSKGKGIEGAIRHVAQETQNQAFIFSGSNPHLIKNMFENDRRPLYKLCKKMALDRITEAHYQTHLNRAAQAQWASDLHENAFEKIILLTERHPFYVNTLCDEIWSEYDKPPNESDVEEAWHEVVEGERSDLIKDFLRLPENQRKVAIHIATHGGKEIFSSQSTAQMQIAPGSLTTAVTSLMERDFIEQTENGYRLIVPAYTDILNPN